MAHNMVNTEVKLGHNHMSDWTMEEIAALYNSHTPDRAESTVSPIVGAEPTEWDWRVAGGVTPIKNQLSCAASGIFASVAAIESAHFVATD